jgi:hypothetical protein
MKGFAFILLLKHLQIGTHTEPYLFAAFGRFAEIGNQVGGHNERSWVSVMIG